MCDGTRPKLGQPRFDSGTSIGCWDSHRVANELTNFRLDAYLKATIHDRGQGAGYTCKVMVAHIPPKDCVERAE